MTARIICSVVIVGLILALAVLSWLTTYTAWQGPIPTGRWTVQVKDGNGRPIRGAQLTVRLCDTGESVPGFFENTAGPGPVVGDTMGNITLYNEEERTWGGTFWKLFWIWTVGDPPDELGLELEISATGYRAQTIMALELIDNSPVLVVLKREFQGQGVSGTDTLIIAPLPTTAGLRLPRIIPAFPCHAYFGICP